MPNFNYKEELPKGNSGNGGGPAQQVPIEYEGTLKVRIGTITDKLSEEHGGVKYGVPFIVEEGEYENWFVWDNVFWDTNRTDMNRIGKEKLAKICQAAGAPEQMHDWTLQIEGLQLALKVKQNPKRPDYRLINPVAIQGYAKQEPASQPAPTSQPAPATAELPQTEEVVSDKIPF